MMVPWWLDRPVDVVNHASPYGAYVDRTRGAGGAARERLPLHTAERPPLWQRLCPCLHTSNAPPAIYARNRDFALGLTLLLDDAREAALRRAPPAQQPLNPWLLRPALPLRRTDVLRTRLLVDGWATTQRTLDLFGRLEPVAVPAVYDANGVLQHAGQAQLLNRIFEQLPPGVSIDFGRNRLGEAEFCAFRFASLRLPYALNLTDNTVSAPVLLHVLHAGMRSLRHLHCRSGLVLDALGVQALVQLLAAQPVLETLELGLQAPTYLRVHRAEAPKVAPLRYRAGAGANDFEAILALPQPRLRSLYLKLDGWDFFDLSGLNLRATPRLETLGLEIELTHEMLNTWRPEAPASLHQFFLPRVPHASHQLRLRFLFNHGRSSEDSFVPKLRGWNSYFDRFVTVLHGATAWSLCRDVPPPHHVFAGPLTSVLELPPPLPDPAPDFAPLLLARASPDEQDPAGEKTGQRHAAALPQKLPRARTRPPHADLPPVDAGGALWRSLVASDAPGGSDADDRAPGVETVAAGRASGVQVWPGPPGAALRGRHVRASPPAEDRFSAWARTPTPEGGDRLSVAYGIAH